MAEVINGVPVPPEVEAEGREAIAQWADSIPDTGPTHPAGITIPDVEEES